MVKQILELKRALNTIPQKSIRNLVNDGRRQCPDIDNAWLLLPLIYEWLYTSKCTHYLKVLFFKIVVQSYKTRNKLQDMFWVNNHKRWLSQNYFQICIFMFIKWGTMYPFKCLKESIQMRFVSNNKWWIKSVTLLLMISCNVDMPSILMSF